MGLHECSSPECDEEELQRCPVYCDVLLARLELLRHPNSPGSKIIVICQPVLHRSIKAFSDHRRTATEQREIEECGSTSGAGR